MYQPGYGYARRGIAITRKVDDVPAVVDKKMIDKHRFPGSSRCHGKPLTAGQHIDKAGFAHIRTADKSIFGKASGRTFLHVRVTDDKFSI